MTPIHQAAPHHEAMVRAAGVVQSELELPFAGSHQVCAPMLDRFGRLPVPQREALETAFGISRGLRPGVVTEALHLVL